MRLLRHVKKTFTLQHDQQDCGIACLLSVIRFYGGNNSIRRLRELCGTSIEGTTLLGLYNCANLLGFTAEGCGAEIESIINYSEPLILHVQYENLMQHFLVCYEVKKTHNQTSFLIGDPAKGVYILDQKELEKIWVSKTCLTLTPNERFIKNETLQRIKFNWIKSLLKDDVSLLGMATAIGVAVACLNLIMAVFSQKLIDEILPQKDLNKLYLSFVLVFLLLILRELLSLVRQYFLLSQSKMFNSRIISRFYDCLLHLPKPFFDTRKIGEFTARLNDTSRIQKVIIQLTGNSIIDALMVITAISFLFTYSWEVASVIICCLPFYFFTIRKFNTDIINSHRKVMVSYANSQSNFISTLLGIESIKNNNKQQLYGDANKDIYGYYQDCIVQLGKIQINLGAITNTFAVFILIVIVLIASFMVINGVLKPGELMAILGISSTLLPSVANLALVSIPINEAKVAFDRMFEFVNLETEEELDGAFGLNNFNSLLIENVSFRFPGRKLLLKNIFISVKKGEIIALMGENGCGKSTLSQIVQKQYLSESGSLLINGDISLKEISLSSWRRLIAVVPQNIHIFNSSVLENIAFDDARSNPQKVVLFLKQFGLSEFIETLPQSYMTLIGEEGISLSGGQKQIIAIARALYHKPQLLILDEATSAMDRESEKFILNLLVKLKSEMGIIFITHRLHVLKSFCDNIYILENGTISSSGNHEELINSKNLYSSYWFDLK